MTRTCTAAVFAAILLFVVGVPVVQAATVSSDGTTATFTAGAGKDDQVDVETVDADTVTFTVSEGTIDEGANCAQVKVDASTCDVTERVVLDLRDGNDQTSGNSLTTHRMTIDGGPGNDFLTGGNLADDLRGGEGNDALHGIRLLDPGTAGADRLDGGPNDDTLVQPAGGDELIGGTGSDRVTVLVGDVTTTPIQPANMEITLDDIPNDARRVDGANVHADVEHIGSYVTHVMEDGVNVSWANSEFGDFDEGGLTARGTDGPNALEGASNNDNLDPLAGNDTVSAGYGDDVVNAVDGFADRVACGPGTDRVTADTLDDVSDSCETVERTEVGVAGAPRDVPEDAPPTIALSVAPGTLTADANDDRGISAVQFLDDDRLVCTDDTAPYTCDYVPRGEDVGRNTLIARAIDTAQQTATDVRAVTVPKFAPAGVKLRATRRGLSGRVLLPAAVDPALGCKGSVSLKPARGARRRVRVKPDCTFTARVKLRRRSRVQARFAGNDVLTTKKRSTRVR